MPIVVVTAPGSATSEVGNANWTHLGAHAIRHTSGLHSHMACPVGDAPNLADELKSREHPDAYLRQSGPIPDKLAIQLAGPPEMREQLDLALTSL